MRVSSSELYLTPKSNLAVQSTRKPVHARPSFQTTWESTRIIAAPAVAPDGPRSWPLAKRKYLWDRLRVALPLRGRAPMVKSRATLPSLLRHGIIVGLVPHAADRATKVSTPSIGFVTD